MKCCAMCWKLSEEIEEAERDLAVRWPGMAVAEDSQAQLNLRATIYMNALQRWAKAPEWLPEASDA